MKTRMTKACMVAMAVLMTVNTVTATDVTGMKKASQTINYVGEMNSYPVFRLNLENPSNSEYSIKISDTEANVLYSEKVKGTEVSRLFRLDVNPDELANIRFVITDNSTRENKVYQVERKSFTSYDLTLSKL